MTAYRVIHDTFVIERTYPTPVSRVFAAFTTKEAQDVWRDTGDLDPSESEHGQRRLGVGLPGRRPRTLRLRLSGCLPTL